MHASREVVWGTGEGVGVERGGRMCSHNKPALRAHKTTHKHMYES
jgi:hypothetical protein